MFVAAIMLQPLPAPFPAMPWIAPDGIARDIIPQGWPSNWAVEIAAHVTMTHGLFPNALLPDAWNSFLAAAWSLSTEWQFYVVALLLGRARMSAGRLVPLFLLLAVLGLAWDLTVPEGWRFSRAFLPNKAQYFALGIASAVWADRGSLKAYAIVLGATLVISAAHGNAGKLVPPLIWTLCLAAQLRPGRFKAIAVPLRWRIMQTLGAISYPIYLANEPVQKALAFVLICFVPRNPIAFDAVWLPAAVALPIGAAALLHRYVETPAQQWGRALARRGNRLGVTTVGAGS
jgi:peptidoglycan/LPS O-acetylase OafA/YrhL